MNTSGHVCSDVSIQQGDLVNLKIPAVNRCTIDNKRIFNRVIEVKHDIRYVLQRQNGVLQGVWHS
jgi:hypothetical protein